MNGRARIVTLGVVICASVACGDSGSATLPPPPAPVLTALTSIIDRPDGTGHRRGDRSARQSDGTAPRHVVELKWGGRDGR